MYKYMYIHSFIKCLFDIRRQVKYEKDDLDIFLLILIFWATGPPRSGASVGVGMLRGRGPLSHIAI